MPTLISIGSTPLARQVSSSASLMAREASATSVSPSQKSTMPSEVPGPSTLIATSGFNAEKASATRAEIGSTVEDPLTAIVPVSGAAVVVVAPGIVVVAAVVVPAAVVVVVAASSSPHATATSAITSKRPLRRHILRVMCLFPSVGWVGRDDPYTDGKNRTKHE